MTAAPLHNRTREISWRSIARPIQEKRHPHDCLPLNAFAGKMYNNEGSGWEELLITGRLSLIDQSCAHKDEGCRVCG